MTKYWLGKHLSIEHKKKLSLAKMRDKIKIICQGCQKEFEVHPYNKISAKYCSRNCYYKNHYKFVSSELRKKIYGRLGLKRSIETRLKISQVAKEGKIGFKHHKVPKWNIERKKEFSKNQIGEKNPNWRGGVTPQRIKLWHSEQYKSWRRTVFIRDEFTCQQCGKKHIYITAHHIKPQVLYPDLIFDLSNGITLCIDCHKKTKTYGYKTVKLLKEKQYAKQL